MAVGCSLGTETYWGNTQDPGTPSAPPSASAPSHKKSSTVKPHASKKQSTPLTASAVRRHSRRRLRGNGPSKFSSFGDPAAEDNPAGDDPVVRQAALTALGNWNGSVVVVDPE